ncbi:hypothetical protein P691DRAFT_758745 [Macrolepiota fuliginosa MF-IS2]|uniref:Uncharacterized protein n=1 Tax=Macrolepiota fuliginosa MF-IS2 TaxID=1400762 RepID=A0A9P6C5X1_9AGAR|nr:hypothetical protein P691DRAFT_758745 [Macrolepiota fuliginosa MF-IS2]
MSYLDRYGRPLSGSAITLPIGIDGNPIKPLDDHKQTPLVLSLLGFAFLFSIYLYFLFSPIIRDNTCVAPYQQVAKIQRVDVEPSKKDLEAGTGVQVQMQQIDNAADILAKRRLREWMHRASHGRFFNPKDSRFTPPKSDKRSLYKRCPSRTFSGTHPNELTPPPPAYASVPSTPVTNRVPEFSTPTKPPPGLKSSIYSRGICTLPRRPTHVHFVSDEPGLSPTLRISQARRSVSDGLISVGGANMLGPHEVTIFEGASSPGSGGGGRNIHSGGRI